MIGWKLLHVVRWAKLLKIMNLLVFIFQIPISEKRARGMVISRNHLQAPVFAISWVH